MYQAAKIITTDTAQYARIITAPTQINIDWESGIMQAGNQSYYIREAYRTSLRFADTEQVGLFMAVHLLLNGRIQQAENYWIDRDSLPTSQYAELLDAAKQHTRTKFFEAAAGEELKQAELKFETFEDACKFLDERGLPSASDSLFGGTVWHGDFWMMRPKTYWSRWGIEIIYDSEHTQYPSYRYKDGRVALSPQGEFISHTLWRTYDPERWYREKNA